MLQVVSREASGIGSMADCDARILPVSEFGIAHPRLLSHPTAAQESCSVAGRH